ncbi:MAG: pole-organizing protein PopZ [Caulobacter sp. 35-67-4]|nr:MAG: pole-organizing protein PopZ [Caulobacter sp. 32-67-35]OYX96864.1 MAG: pole-organizing protein PopZ [Caulobacter sp. 35-67-4]
MSDQSSQEPTMEEILASIRRIISEDDAPAEPEAAAPAPAPEPEPEYQAPAEDDVLELTDPIEPEPAHEPEPAPLESVGDLDVYSPAAPEPEPAYTPPPAPSFNRDDVAETLVGDHASSLAASAFGSLSSALLMPKDGRTLEDVVRELLRPLLKEWLDQNLPRIVETKVEEEVHRIARGRV